ncbi:HDIG domain-containing protein [Parabacteroides sp. OttesenSCG-928-G07]|nr:HDIG domain-containing protein [Parabacteroides sp. OttesenSCG-928-G07]
MKNVNIPTILYFLVTAVLIAYFFPREAKFRYQFFEGKPWRYGLLTAPNDFPIYKTDQELKQEKDSLLRFFSPYYRLDAQVAGTMNRKLQDNYNTSLHNIISTDYKQYLERMLTLVYKNGIVSPENWDELQSMEAEDIQVVENNISRKHYKYDLFTVRAAYEYIMVNTPARLDRTLLQECNIDDYLTVSLTYDDVMTERVRDELLNSVPLSRGIIQSGERIVDRGEIIDAETYNALRSLKIVYETRSGGDQRQWILIGGMAFLVFALIACYWLYLWSFRKPIFYNKRSVLFMVLCILVSCVLCELVVSFDLFNVYILPFAIIPMVVRVFFDSRTALFTHLIIVLICSLIVPFPHEFLFLQTIAGMVVTFSLKDLSERSQLIRTSAFIFLSYTLCFVSLSLYQGVDFAKINWTMLLYFGINFILLMFTYILVYMLEKTFGYTSSISLVELSNINTPILKKLSEIAPGTFQHSIQVSILASEAATKIGANAQLVRTGALYHDIGKMQNPAFFTENQSSVNPHLKLPLEQSAQIIISHVSEGVKIAEKAGLPKAIINFIRTHHGRGITKFFYNTFKNNYPDKEIDIEKFTYPGPNPFTKETAILMMADSVEAASRSLKEQTEEGIQELVNRIIDGQLADGLYKNAPITFRDIDTVKQVFIEKLKTMFHTRISYPELKNELKVDDKADV